MKVTRKIGYLVSLKFKEDDEERVINYAQISSFYGLVKFMNSLVDLMLPVDELKDWDSEEEDFILKEELTSLVLPACAYSSFRDIEEGRKEIIELIPRSEKFQEIGARVYVEKVSSIEVFGTEEDETKNPEKVYDFVIKCLNPDNNFSEQILENLKKLIYGDIDLEEFKSHIKVKEED